MGRDARGTHLLYRQRRECRALVRNTAPADPLFNQHFNRSMRLKARKLGYRLNQRALYKDVARDPKTGLKLTEGVRVPCRTEKDIFDKLGVPYRPPTERIP